ncbi:DNA-binding response regulator [Anaerobacillus alkalidiazotrophicus]|uniref:DNA-binding response regulator n=1 Tax=Anaerobacillus alkalidiazotrophicus TaxID=472963 RepID=A0A1S2MCW6_9BACI|nr:response regulator [Anaerobacillus alkalidiazotrophicus]OIJ22414.1 DNA-binding response regulator [Anaerobacillus alkalidiazotrophicus]
MKVLIVDDELNVHYVIRHLGQWKKNGITDILEARNGKEAIRIIEKENPEIIFTDVKMPGMSGIEIIEWLNTISYPGKVIVITGFDDYSFMRKAIQCSSFDYLLKPVEAEPFNKTLEEAVKAWANEEKDRLYKETGAYEDVKRLHMNQVVTKAYMGELFDASEITSCLPPADEYDLTLISFYQMHHSDPYIQLLADELVAQKLGNAFALQNDQSLCLVITKQRQWLLVEEWISQQFDIPVRIIRGDPLKSMEDIPQSIQSLQKALEDQNFRAVHRLNDLDDARRMQNIVSYVEMYYMEELSLEKLSNRFFLSREHISRKFKKETGMPLSKYIMKLRTDKAKYWLRETDESIYSISLMLGYQDEKYFSKLFKKVVGMTPFEYRNCEKKLQTGSK